jgi:predicted phosphodiesterase
MTVWADLNPTMIAVSGDWHGNQHFAKRAIEYAKNQGAEAILHVGDFGYTFSRKFMSGVDYALCRAGLPLAFADGNHENHELLNNLVDAYSDMNGGQLGAIQWRGSANVFYLPRTFRWEWSGVRFLALGGAHSVDRQWRTPGVEWWPDERISWRQAQNAAMGGPADVMICHDVPAGVDIPWIGGNPLGFPPEDLIQAENHRELLRSVVDHVQPKVLYAGHYHGRLTAELPGTTVEILDMDRDPISNNTVIVDLESLKERHEETPDQVR